MQFRVMIAGACVGCDAVGVSVLRVGFLAQWLSTMRVLGSANTKPENLKPLQNCSCRKHY